MRERIGNKIKEQKRARKSHPRKGTKGSDKNNNKETERHRGTEGQEWIEWNGKRRGPKEIRIKKSQTGAAEQTINNGNPSKVAVRTDLLSWGRIAARGHWPLVRGVANDLAVADVVVHDTVPFVLGQKVEPLTRRSVDS